MREGVRKVNIVVVLHGGDVSLVSQLVRVLIERTILLFSIPSFQTVMRRSHTHTSVRVLVRAIIVVRSGTAITCTFPLMLHRHMRE